VADVVVTPLEVTALMVGSVGTNAWVAKVKLVEVAVPAELAERTA
jgi:hypothetical protein